MTVLFAAVLTFDLLFPAIAVHGQTVPETPGRSRGLTRSSTMLGVAAAPTVNTSSAPSISLSGTPLGGVTVSLVPGASTITDATGNYSFTGLTAGTTYTVTPSLAGYTFSPPSQTVSYLSGNQVASFTASIVNSVPGLVNLTSPGTGATNQSTTPTLSWSASSNANSYDLYLGNSNPPSVYAQNLSGTSYVVSTTLNAGSTYYWNVVAKNSMGSAPASSTWSFTMAAAVPGQVMLTSPGSGAASQSTTPTLSWSASSNANSYDLYLGNSNPSSVYVYAQNLSGTSFVVSTALNAGSTYYWNVVAKNSMGSAPASSTWSFTTAAVTPLTAGLIGYWNFDEGSGGIARDTSGSGYNGVVNGASWTTGKINSALSFNGTTSDVVTPNIALGNTFSVSAWVNPAVSVESSYARIAETEYAPGFYLGTNASGASYKWIVNGGAGTTGSCGAGYGCAEGGAVSSGWHLVTATFDGTTARLYVDNALVGSDTFSAPPNTNLPLYIGRYYAASLSGWNGAIDEVRLYSRALTSAEVSAIYNYTGGL